MRFRISVGTGKAGAGVGDREAGEKEHVLEHPDDLRPRLNADRRRHFGQPGRMLALVCECADPECHNTVLISAEDYDSIRPALVLYPGHEAARVVPPSTST